MAAAWSLSTTPTGGADRFACGYRRRSMLHWKNRRPALLKPYERGSSMSADILVVDDEADIRDLVAGILEDEGHRTRTAGSSDEALALHRSTAAPSGVSRHLAAGQPSRRLAGPRTRQGRPSRSAGRDDLRARQRGDGGIGHQGRRLRLHREAVQGRSPGAGGGTRARSLAAEARGARPARPLGAGDAGSPASPSPSTSCGRRWSGPRRRMRASS